MNQEAELNNLATKSSDIDGNKMPAKVPSEEQVWLLYQCTK